MWQRGRDELLRGHAGHILGLDGATAALRVAQVVETYLMRRLHDTVYPWLLRRCGKDERRFVDALRQARCGRRRDISAPKYACDLDDETRKAASALRDATSPLDKLLCMKRVTSALTRDVDRTYQQRLLRVSDGPVPIVPELATDDVIDLIVYLFVSHRDTRSIPFLPTDLKYIQMFHFVQVSTSALGFFLSNFEVANDVLLDKDNAKTTLPYSCSSHRAPLTSDKGCPSKKEVTPGDYTTTQILQASRDEFAAAREVLTARKASCGPA